MTMTTKPTTLRTLFRRLSGAVWFGLAWAWVIDGVCKVTLTLTQTLALTLTQAS